MPTNYYGNAPGAEQANAFNQQQYHNTLAGYDTAYASANARGQGVLGEFGNMLNTAQNANQYQKYMLGQQNYVANQGALANAIRSGLGNSSYLNDLQNQANQNSWMQQMQLNDQLTNQRLGIMGQRAQYRDALNQQLTGLQGEQSRYMGNYGSQLANVGPEQLYPSMFLPQHNQAGTFGVLSGGGGGGGGYTYRPSVGTGYGPGAYGAYQPSPYGPGSPGLSNDTSFMMGPTSYATPTWDLRYPTSDPGGNPTGFYGGADAYGVGGE